MEKRFVLSSFVIKFYIICMVIAVNGLSISIAVTANTSPSNRMSDSNATITFLRVATTLQAPLVMKDKSSPKGFKGYSIDLLDEIARIFKFDYEVYEVKDKTFGAMNSKGEWNGIVRELLDKRADIGLPLSYVTSERDAVVDFTTPLTDMAGLTILMKRDVKSYSLFMFLKILEWKVWLCIAVAFFSASLMMWMIDRGSSFIPRYGPKEKHHGKYGSISDWMWFCLISSTPQGASKPPKSLSGKIAMATWWLFSFIIIATYTANLAAFLTVVRLDKPIESLDDLSNQFKVKYSTLNASTLATYFQRMCEIENRIYDSWMQTILDTSIRATESAKFAVWSDPVGDKYKKIWRVIQDTGMPNSIKEAVERVRKSTPDDAFAFLGDGPELRYLELMSCDLKTVGEDFAVRTKAIPLQEGSPLKEMLDDAIFELHNRRFLDTLQAKWWNRDERNIKCTEFDELANEIPVDNIGGLFILILMGISMALIVILFEFLWFKYREKFKILTVMERKRPRMKKDHK